MQTPKGFKGNPNLKPRNTILEFNELQVTELIKCATDPIYFIESYIKISTLDNGIQLLKLRPYQKNLIETVHDGRFTIIKFPRQAGKCFFPNINITIRNKKTNQEETLTVGEFYDRINKSNEKHETTMHDMRKDQQETMQNAKLHMQPSLSTGSNEKDED